MLKKLTAVAAAMALAMAVVVLATVVEASSAHAEMPALTAADLQSDRGTVIAIDMESRTMVVNTVAEGDVAYQVLDGVKGFSSLKVGTVIDLRYYRIVDLLVTKTTPEVKGQVRALLQDPEQAPDIPGTKLKTRVWGARGIATRIDFAANRIDVAQGGTIYRTPAISTDAGVAALKTLKVGDKVTVLFTERTAVEIRPVP